MRLKGIEGLPEVDLSGPLKRIIIKGAREHNLKDIDLEIPRDRFVVITGISGSGKSTLAFDTLYAEGQRRYVESLSTYARQFMEKLEKPDVESIEGLSPAISIDQRTASRGLRSTVGTVTEVYNYLRLLYTHFGRPYCYNCGKEIRSQTLEEMIRRVERLPEGSLLIVYAPIVRGRKGEYRKELDALRRDGFSKVRIDGEMRDLMEEIVLDRMKRHYIDVVIDRLYLKPSVRQRLSEALERATGLARGMVLVEYYRGGKVGLRPSGSILFNEKLYCVDCGIGYPEITPTFFSFNSPDGACPACKGLGVISRVELPEEEELLPEVVEAVCEECKGTRLRKEALYIRIRGRSIADLASMSVTELMRFLRSLRFRKGMEEVGRKILREMVERLKILVEVGLGYLTMDRPAYTLSGGESNRVRLASQIASDLSGVLYVLDEPTVGLHPRDNVRLLQALKRLRDMGNTVIVVEHDEETIRSADHIIDMGPGAGEEGGEVVSQGTLQDIMEDPRSLTGRYLKGDLTIPVPKRRRPGKRHLVIKGVRTNNLKGITVSFPLGLFICVTGVSGSGKSSLVMDTLYRALYSHLHGEREEDGRYEAIEGLEYIDRVINIDQSPIGRTPRSNPATYTGAFTFIRELFSMLPEARMRGYRPGRFSFNVKGGRCERCRGAGVMKVEMHFLPDVYVTCDQCNGKRYNPETLAIKYRGKDISDILEMTVSEALQFFEPVPHLKRKLSVLNDVGLGYIRLGQPATTLSGGEAQRLKLSRELSKKGTGKTVYILDEPTTGLHFHDVKKLLNVLHALVDAGNTVIVIEHNLDVVKSADYLIDLGPEGGDEGGWVVACGTPEEVVEVEASYTGRFLREKLAREGSLCL